MLPDVSIPPPPTNWVPHPMQNPMHIRMNPHIGHRPQLPMNYQYPFGPHGMQPVQDRGQNYGYMGISSLLFFELFKKLFSFKRKYAALYSKSSSTTT